MARHLLVPSRATASHRHSSSWQAAYIAGHVIVGWQQQGVAGAAQPRGAWAPRARGVATAPVPHDDASKATLLAHAEAAGWLVCGARAVKSASPHHPRAPFYALPVSPAAP